MTDIQTINKKPIIIGIAGLLLFLFAYTVFVYFRIPTQQTVSLDTKKWNTLGSRLFFWLLLFALGLYTKKAEHRTILDTPQKRYAWWFYIVAMITMYFVLVIGSGILLAIAQLISRNQISPNYASMKLLFQRYPALMFFTAFTAGVTEEFFFRGYLQSRLSLLFNKSVGIIVSAVLFGLLHYNYGTLIQVLFPFYLGLIFSIFYEKYRNIYFLIIFHFVWDIVALYSLTHIKIPHH